MPRLEPEVVDGPIQSTVTQAFVRAELIWVLSTYFTRREWVKSDTSFDLSDEEAERPN